MEVLTEIQVSRTRYSRIRDVDFDNLEFGRYVSDHMLICDYTGGEWHAPRILPFANLSVSPTTQALHYGQTVFEGMKAFKMHDGRVNIFRVDKHYDRFVRSLERMCMAVVPKEIFVEGLLQLIAVDKAWIPSSPASLYIRPFMFASEAKFGIKISDEYRFIIFTGPVPALFAEPIKVKVETKYIRAAKGGTGYAKCGGNYGGTYFATRKANLEGYSQLLWTDAKENKYIEESGFMNAMFVINDVLVTPPLSDSILDGITRNSLLTIAGDMGYKIEERPVSIDELKKAFEDGTISEAFGTGTAALVAPIGTIGIHGSDFNLPEYSSESVMHKLKDHLQRIRSGEAEDVYAWNYII